MARLDRRGEGRNFYANLMGMPGDYQALDASRETSQADEDLFAMPEYAIREPQFDMHGYALPKSPSGLSGSWLRGLV